MWRDLLGRRPEPSAALAAALADLDRLATNRPELESPAKSLGRVLGAAFGTPPRLLRPYDFGLESPGFDEVRRAWGSGGTAFRAYPPEFDPDDLRARSSAICRALKSDNAGAASLARAGVDWRDLAVLAVTAGRGEVERRALDLCVSPELLASVLRLALLPVLAACTAGLAPHRTDLSGPLQHCPNCGEAPSLAELRGLEGRRFLRCGLCATDWPAPRLGCVSCGESSPHSLRSLFVEGEESRHRLVRCSSCGFDLKVVSTLSPISAPGLLVTELATVHLDFL